MSDERRNRDPISYALKQKNDEDLRHTDYGVPRILVVVFAPEQVADWTAHTEQELTMRYCAYWVSLRGLPPSTNKHTTTVYLPRKNLFNVQGLEAIMDQVVRLKALAPAQGGNVTVAGLVDDSIRQVQFSAGPDDYQRAIEAHQHERIVSVEGELIKDGRSFRLNNPHMFSVAS